MFLLYCFLQISYQRAASGRAFIKTILSKTTLHYLYLALYFTMPYMSHWSIIRKLFLASEVIALTLAFFVPAGVIEMIWELFPVDVYYPKMIFINLLAGIPAVFLLRYFKVPNAIILTAGAIVAAYLFNQFAYPYEWRVYPTEEWEIAFSYVTFMVQVIIAYIACYVGVLAWNKWAHQRVRAYMTKRQGEF